MSTDAGDSGVGAAGAHSPAGQTPDAGSSTVGTSGADTPAAGSSADRAAAGTSADTAAGTSADTAAAGTSATGSSTADTSTADTSTADTSAADTSGGRKADLHKEDTGNAGGQAATPTGSATGIGRGLKVHHLRPAPGAHRDKTRVGRGQGSKGKTAGRGTKGSKARKQIPARFEGGQMPLHMRVPKLKGFTNPFRVEYQVVNLARLGELFPAGGLVGPDELVAAGAVRAGYPVKVLGDGELATAVEVSAHAFSASAREKIVAAGGSTAVISRP